MRNQKPVIHLHQHPALSMGSSPGGQTYVSGRNMSLLIFMMLSLLLTMTTRADALPPTREEATVNLLQILNLGALILVLGVVYVLAWAGFLAFVILGRMVWPARTECIETTIARSPWKSLLLGLVNLLGCFIILLLLRGTPFAPPLFLLFLLGMTYFLLKGMPALLYVLGEKILEQVRPDSSALQKTVAGGVLMALLFLFPIAGQLSLLLLKLTAFGGSLLSTFTLERKRKSATS